MRACVNPISFFLSGAGQSAPDMRLSLSYNIYLCVCVCVRLCGCVGVSVMMISIPVCVRVYVVHGTYHKTSTHTFSLCLSFFLSGAGQSAPDMRLSLSQLRRESPLTRDGSATPSSFRHLGSFW